MGLDVKYGARGPELYRDGKLLGYAWDHKPLSPLKINHTELLTLVWELRNKRLWYPLLHRLYFWVLGSTPPDDYHAWGLTVGATDNGLYFLGRPARPEDIYQHWGSAVEGLGEHELLRLEAWLVEPETWNPSRSLPVPAVTGDKNTLVSLNGRVLCGPSDRRPRSELLEEIAQVPIERLLRLGVPAAAAWKINPELPRARRVYSHWYRDGALWGLVEVPGKQGLWLAGPSGNWKVGTQLDPLRELLEMGHLRPDDPSCYLWAYAVTGVRPSRYPSGVRSISQFRDCWIFHKEAREEVYQLKNGRWVLSFDPHTQEDIVEAAEQGLLFHTHLSWHDEGTVTPWEYCCTLQGIPLVLGYREKHPLPWVLGSSFLEGEKTLVAAESLERLRALILEYSAEYYLSIRPLSSW